jgi:hypothetical protein
VNKTFGTCAIAMAAAAILTAQGASSVVHGTVKKIDAAAKTVAIATATGAEEVVHFTDKTVVHGTEVGAKDALHGLKVGSEVVVHTTASGATKTAVEIDHLGKGGLKVVEGTISKVGAGGKTVAVKTADGAEVTFDVTANAATDVAKETAAGAEKAGKVSLYYTEEGGKKIAHFFKKL